MAMRHAGWGWSRDRDKFPKRDRLKEIAREALPALIAEVERLQQEVESLRARVTVVPRRGAP
jgi:hypothetical protein